MKYLHSKFFPTTISCLFYLVLSIAGYAQQDRQDEFTIVKDIVYSANDTLKADIYLPLNYQRQKNPVLIFVDGFGGSDFRQWGHYKNWAKVASSNGFVTVVYQSRRNETKSLLEKVLQFAEKNAADYSMDAERISIFGSSGNVPVALTFANDEKRIKAALIYYGLAPIKTFRTDLPVMLVRSGFDNVALNRALDTLVFRAMQANAPYTVFNFNTGYHPFEDVNDPEKVRIMKASLDFLKENTRKEVRENFQRNENEIAAIRGMYASDWPTALKSFQLVLKEKPNDNEIERQVGNVYIELKDYNKALEYFVNAQTHGNWRRAEIARQKCLAFAMLNNIEGAVSELKVLKSIGPNFFRESDFSKDPVYKNVLNSEAYKKFIREGK